MKRCYLITGVTGFLGQEVLRLVAERRDVEHIYCLVRPGEETPRERLYRILSELGLTEDSRVTAVAGDMAQPKLGVAAAHYRRLGQDVTHIVHCAADVRFNRSLEDMRRINVGGARHIVELASHCSSLNPLFSHLAYVSTAFVVGRRVGALDQDQVAGAAGFRNTYEQSKHEAEQVVRAAMQGHPQAKETGGEARSPVPIIIYRPSIVVGAAQSGQAKAHNVIYPMLKLFKRWFLPLVPVVPEVHLDIVPVDFVAQALLAISDDSRHIGRAFHLTAGPGRDITLGQMLTLVQREFGKKVRTFPVALWKILVRPLLTVLLGPRYRRVSQSFHVFSSYVWQRGASFTCATTQAALATTDVSLPDTGEFIAACLRYANRHNFEAAADKAGVVENSVCQMFRRQVWQRRQAPCVSYKEGEGYRTLTWLQVDHKVRCLASFLASRGIGRGDRVAILAETRYEWWIADLGTLSCGAVDVPLHTTISAAEVGQLLQHSGARACFVDGPEQLSKVSSVAKSCPRLQFVVVFDALQSRPSRGGDVTEWSFAQALQIGELKRAGFAVDKSIDGIRADDLATIIYTSGTTGEPKGVMLSHGNLVNNVQQVEQHYRGRLTLDHVFLSFLPLSHAFERMGGFYLALRHGIQVCFAQGVDHLLQNLQEVRPTSFVAVPILFQKMHRALFARLAQASPIRRALFRVAMAIGKKNIPLLKTDTPRRGLYALLYALAHRVVFSRIKKRLGMDRLMFAVSGGSALPAEVVEFFMCLDVRIVEGYGLTEASPVVTAQLHNRLQPGTVGREVPGTELKLAADGEILLRGPQIMVGYFRDQAASDEAFTEDGFLRTGDLGYRVESGDLVLTGRKKEILVTNGGHNISPLKVETRLSYSRYIERSAVVGDGRDYPIALIVPDFEELELWGHQQGLSWSDHNQLVQLAEVRDLLTVELKRVQADLSRQETIRTFELLDHSWSIEEGQLTPSLRVKRRVVEANYSDLIEGVYNSAVRSDLP